MTGIYSITNKANNKRYIGQCLSMHGFKKRWANHKNKLNNNSHPNQHLQNAWNKYGEDNFQFIIIERCKKDITEKEQYWVDYYNTSNREFGYNKRICAESNKGLKQSSDSIKKMVKNNSNTKLSFIKAKKIRDIYATGIYSLKQIAEMYAVTATCIRRVVINQTWKTKDGQITRSKENIKKQLSKMRSGERNSCAKLNLEIVNSIREKYSTGRHSFNDLAGEYNISQGAVQAIVENRSWMDKNYEFISRTKKEINKEISKKNKGRLIGENNPSAKLNWEIVREIRKNFNEGFTRKEIIKKHNVSGSNLHRILKNIIWKE